MFLATNLHPFQKGAIIFCSLKKPFQANRHAAFKEIKCEVVVTIAKKASIENAKGKENLKHWQNWVLPF